MVSTDTLVSLYRRIHSRRAKSAALAALRLLHRRYLLVRLDTTNACNLRCRMCYTADEGNRARQDMSVPLYEKIAGQVFSKARFLYLGCATEPLLNNDFKRLVAITAKSGVPFVSLCTNGMLMTEEIADALIAGGFSEIIFSVDGATRETYEFIRRGARWEKLVSVLDMLDARKRALGSQTPQGRINFTCMRRNIGELPGMVKFAGEHGIKKVHVRHLLRFGDSDPEMPYSTAVDYLRMYDQSAAAAREQAPRSGVELSLPTAPGSRVQAPGKGGKACEANPYCMVPWFEVVIGSNGIYRLCSTFPAFGNLAEESFESIYDGGKMKELRKSLLRRSPDACSWKCHQEAYEAPEAKPPERPT